MLVISGIVLALAFLTYILCSDVLTNRIVSAGPADLVERLQADGKLVDLGDADARVRTWWLVGLAGVVFCAGPC